MMEEFARNIDHEIEPVTNHIDSFRGFAAQIKAENNTLFNRIQAVEEEIKNEGEKMKQSVPHLIDFQISKLLHKLRSAEEEAKLQVDVVQLALTEMESFRESSLELRSKVSPGDATQAANDVRVRAKELLQKHAIPAEYHAPRYKFIPANIAELLRDDQNFIGHVAEDEDPGTVYTYRRRISFLRNLCEVCTNVDVLVRNFKFTLALISDC